MTAYAEMQSPVGRLLLVSDEAGLREIRFEKEGQTPEPDWRNAPEELAQERKQLEQYFAGERQEFELRLAPEGTPFQQRVWQELARIPYGETISYGELAKRVGNPAASRAVGAANGQNPIPIVLPCHRVIGSNGKLVGFGGGLDIKQALLETECRVASDQGHLFDS